MTETVGYVQVQVLPVAPGFGGKLGQQIAPQVRGQGQYAGQQFTQSFSQSVGSTMQSIGSKLTLGLTAPIVGVGAAATVMGLKTAASLEQAGIAFESLLGSGEAAQSFLSDLREFAATTPFEMPGLVDASRQLVAVGVEANEVIPFLTDYGDAMGGLGLGQEQFNRIMLATTQMMANGRVNGGDLLQMTQAGMPVWAMLSKALGKSTAELKEMSSRGELLTEDVLPALRAQMHEDYGGAMVKQSQTLTGLWSTFMDTINMGLSDSLTEALPQFKGALAEITAAIAPALKGIGPAFAGIAAAITPVISAFSTLLQWFGSLNPEMQRLILIGVGIAAAIGPVVGIIGSLIGAISTIAGVISLPVVAVVAAVAAIGGGFALLYQNSQEVRDAVAGIFQVLSRAFEEIKAAVLPLVASIRDHLSPILKTLGEKLGPTVATVLQTIGKVIGGVLLPAFKLAIAAISKMWELLGPIVVPVVAEAIGVILDHLKGMFEFVGMVADLIGAVFSGDWEKAWLLAQELPNKLLQVIATSLGNIGKLIVNMAGNVLSRFGEFMINLNRKVVEFADRAKDWLVEAGKNLITGLIDGLKSMATAPIDFLKGIGESMIDGFKDLFGIASPSKLMKSYGRNVSEGLAIGIRDGYGDAEKAYAGLLSAPGAPRLGLDTSSALATAAGSRGAVNVTNYYPQAEPSSITVNRALGLAALAGR